MEKYGVKREDLYKDDGIKAANEAQNPDIDDVDSDLADDFFNKTEEKIKKIKKSSKKSPKSE